MVIVVVGVVGVVIVVGGAGNHSEDDDAMRNVTQRKWKFQSMRRFGWGSGIGFIPEMKDIELLAQKAVG